MWEDPKCNLQGPGVLCPQDRSEGTFSQNNLGPSIYSASRASDPSGSLTKPRFPSPLHWS